MKQYQIGMHRLIVGDSFSSEVGATVAEFMPDVVIIDPPYEVPHIYRNSIPSASHNTSLLVMWDDIRADDALRSAFNAGWMLRSEFIWDHVTSWRKNGRALIRHRSCGVFTSGRGQRFRASVLDNGSRLQTVYKHQKTQMSGHPHAKPLEWVRAVLGSVDPERVFDPFLGSGTTMVACEQLGVPCVGVEISQGYASDALKLVQSYSGAVAEEF